MLKNKKTVEPQSKLSVDKQTARAAAIERVELEVKGDPVLQNLSAVLEPMSTERQTTEELRQFVSLQNYFVKQYGDANELPEVLNKLYSEAYDQLVEDIVAGRKIYSDAKNAADRVTVEMIRRRYAGFSTCPLTDGTPDKEVEALAGTEKRLDDIGSTVIEEMIPLADDYNERVKYWAAQTRNAAQQTEEKYKERPHPFGEACEKGDVDLFTSILTKLKLKPSKLKALLNSPTPTGDYPLLIACRRGHFTLALRLLAHGASATVKNNQDHTAMHEIAAWGKDTQAIKVLTRLQQAGAHPDAKTASSHRTPLHRAAFHGNLEVCRWLLDQPCVNVNAAELGNPITPLHWAVLKGRVEVVTCLLDRNAHPWVTTDLGETPLVSALIRYLETSALLEGEKEPGESKSETVLATPINNPHLAIVYLFLNRGITLSASDWKYLAQAADAHAKRCDGVVIGWLTQASQLLTDFVVQQASHAQTCLLNPATSSQPLPGAVSYAEQLASSRGFQQLMQQRTGKEPVSIPLPAPAAAPPQEENKAPRSLLRHG